MESNSVLNDFVDCQQRLISQFTSQRDISSEVSKCSKDEISELRLLSLVRMKLIRSPIRTPEMIVSSQTFQGLQFSPFEYCPSFFQGNRMNCYQRLVSQARKAPDILARALFNYSILHPDKIHRLAFSLFLTLFQQGWSFEEDTLLCETLKSMADIQFSTSIDQQKASTNTEIMRRISNTNEPLTKPPPPRLLKFPIGSVESACEPYQPFVTFSTAYLFNGASFSYLQTALAPIITKLHSLSHLFDLRSHFDIKKAEPVDCLAPIQYWTEIVSYAKEVLLSLTNCLQLLPSSFSTFFAYLAQKKVDLSIIVFESFINLALDNPAVLGLLPWHPSHGDWNPSKDIANVFRTKFLKSLQSQSLAILQKILISIDGYLTIDINKFLTQITIPPNSTYMISENELLETNPLFPKDLLFTGSDCLLLHHIFAECDNLPDDIKNTLTMFGSFDTKTPEFKMHFLMNLARTKNSFIKPLKTHMTISLFDSPQASNSPEKQNPNEKKNRDFYTEQLCDVISELPPLFETGATSIKEFMSISREIAPFLLDSSGVDKAAAVLWYAETIIPDESEIVQRILKVIEGREKHGVAETDRTSSLRAQHQRILATLKLVKTMRENLQSNFNLELSEILTATKMSQNFKDAMIHCHEFINDSKIFKKTVIAIKKSATEILEGMNLTEKMINEVCRLLFFKLTDHITFKRYIQNRTDVWKKSIILSKIIEKNRPQLLKYAEKGQPADFFVKQAYLERAADLLGHIRQNSGMSIILYYVLETENVIQTLCSSCRDLEFNGCLLWVLIKTQAKHIYMISKFIQHFILQGGFLDRFFLREEISNLGIFSSSLLLLLDACKKYDSRIQESWA